LPPETLQRIAFDYMDRIGFGDQPFLVYQHHDAKHPHIHIVTTCIQPDGTSIDLHNIGQELSEPAREALEKEYGLTRARGREKHLENTEAPDLAAKVQEVTSSYKFTSVDELNAILAQFGMTAWPGAPGSAIRSNRGLIYSRIDADGNRIGTPIKSSDLVTRPTLAWLEKRFEVNKIKKLACCDRAAKRLATALRGGISTILQQLDQAKIGLQPLRDKSGNLISVCIIDNRTKAVFSSEELGWQTDALLARLDLALSATTMVNLLSHQSLASGTALPADDAQKKTPSPQAQQSRPNLLVSPARTAVAAQVAFVLLSSQTGIPGPAGDEPPKKKKRKKRSL
jgi:hypothetical protein